MPRLFVSGIRLFWGRDNANVPPLLEVGDPVLVGETAAEDAIEIDILPAGHSGKGAMPMAEPLVAGAGENFIGEAHVPLIGNGPCPISGDGVRALYRPVEGHFVVRRVRGEQGRRRDRVTSFPSRFVGVEPRGEDCLFKDEAQALCSQGRSRRAFSS